MFRIPGIRGSIYKSGVRGAITVRGVSVPSGRCAVVPFCFRMRQWVLPGLRAKLAIAWDSLPRVGLHRASTVPRPSAVCEAVAENQASSMVLLSSVSAFVMCQWSGSPLRPRGPPAHQHAPGGGAQRCGRSVRRGARLYSRCRGRRSPACKLARAGPQRTRTSVADLADQSRGQLRQAGRDFTAVKP